MSQVARLDQRDLPGYGRFVNVDASYADHLAGIAFVGFIGRRQRVVGAVSSVHAELLALLFAMDAAEEHGVSFVVFRTDCRVISDRNHPGGKHDEAARVCALLARNPGWQVRYVPRGQYVQAHALARRARRRSAL